MPELSTENANPPSAHGAPVVGADSGCPTPLAWQDVLQRVRAERRRLTATAGSVRMTAFAVGADAPLFLIPGFVGDYELYVLTSWLLRDECCCVMVDPPLVPPDVPDALRLIVQGLSSFADELGHRTFRVHATSFGSLIALRAALDLPERVAAVSLHCGFAYWRLSHVERLLAAIGSRSSRSLGELHAAVRLQAANHRRWFPPFDASRWDFYLQNVGATPLANIARRALIANNTDLRDELGRIQTPVLLVDCEGDGRVSGAAQSVLRSALPKCRTDSLDNCGRLPQLTHPHRLVKSLRQFWEEAT